MQAFSATLKMEGGGEYRQTFEYFLFNQAFAILFCIPLFLLTWPDRVCGVLDINCHALSAYLFLTKIENIYRKIEKTGIQNVFMSMILQDLYAVLLRRIFNRSKEVTHPCCYWTTLFYFLIRPGSVWRGRLGDWEVNGGKVRMMLFEVRSWGGYNSL